MVGEAEVLIYVIVLLVIGSLLLAYIAATLLYSIQFLKNDALLFVNVSSDQAFCLCKHILSFINNSCVILSS